ncbi:MAG: DUF362 domain-containing protein [Candidatus Schekmanbacteria bacterium]|nr:DUF362 domain-containing protein [Candidatus Schekmanbacteria bacterium]
MARRERPAGEPAGAPRQLTRRAFLTRALGAAGVTSAAAYAAYAPEDWPGAARDADGLRSVPAVKPFRLTDFRVAKPVGAPDVAVGHGGDAMTRLRKALDALGGLAHYVSPGDIVLLKPNVAFDRAPVLAATTNPEILAALIRLILVDCRAQEVRVADNPIESPADCFAKSGIAAAVASAGGRVYLPDANAFRILNTPDSRLIENWQFFHRPLTNANKVIGVAPVKDHNLCLASMGMKNWYGLLGGRRNQFHQDIHELVSDLSLMIRPTLTILDGTYVLMRNGPTGGDPADVRPGDAVVAAVDPVAADAWAYRHLLSRTTELPRYLLLAEEKGTGSASTEGRVREIA